MHGLVFAALRAYAETRLGADATASAWGDASYDADAAYGDDEFAARLELLRAASGDEPDTFERGLGAFTAQTVFVGMFPGYYGSSAGTIDFLLGLEKQIHEVVRATMPGAHPPHLHIQPLGHIGALVSYTSERRLCRLLEGLVLGTASHFGEDVAVEEIQCMRRDDPACVFTVLPREHAV